MLLAPYEPYQVALIGVHAARVVGVEIGLEGVVGSNVIALGWRAIERGMDRCGSHLMRLESRSKSNYDLSMKKEERDRERDMTDVFDDAKMKSTFHLRLGVARKGNDPLRRCRLLPTPSPRTLVIHELSILSVTSRFTIIGESQKPYTRYCRVGTHVRRIQQQDARKTRAQSEDTLADLSALRPSSVRRDIKLTSITQLFPYPEFSFQIHCPH